MWFIHASLAGNNFFGGSKKKNGQPENVTFGRANVLAKLYTA
jgi:hypothetical protein